MREGEREREILCQWKNMCKCGHDFVMHFCAWLCMHFSDRFMGNVWVLYGTIGLVGWFVRLASHGVVSGDSGIGETTMEVRLCGSC